MALLTQCHVSTNKLYFIVFLSYACLLYIGKNIQYGVYISVNQRFIRAYKKQKKIPHGVLFYFCSKL